MKFKIGHINLTIIALFIIMNSTILITEKNLNEWQDLNLSNLPSDILKIDKYDVEMFKDNKWEKTDSIIVDYDIYRYKNKHQKSLLFKFIKYVGPFLLGLIILKVIYKRNKIKTDAFLFACMGLFITLLGDAGNTTGIIFLCFSVYIFNSEKSLLVIFILTVVAIIIKMLILKLTAIGVINIFIMYSYIGAVYYALFHPKKLRLESNNQIDAVTTEIIELMIQGFSPKEIHQKMKNTISVDAISKRIRRVRNQFDSKNEAQLIITLIKKGLICPKKDN
jgi:hypothetical protein